jgi:PhzF family phenazine biosynthesis protein
MNQKIFQVDAFAERPFEGNPAAVCLLPEPIDDALMQSIAMEMNLSETAFLVKEEDHYSLRWFTPAVEVDLCGHATLASSHILWTEYGVKEKTLRFQTRSGELQATRDSEYIWLNFPATDVKETEAPPGLIEAIGVAPHFVGTSRFDYLVEVDSPEVVRSVRPDIGKLKEYKIRGVIVTAKGGGEFDFISRFFAPGAGVDEDPVTGSAHCALGPYWMSQLGKAELSAYQASARGGKVRVRVEKDRVYLGGKAITTLDGNLIWR